MRVCIRRSLICFLYNVGIGKTPVESLVFSQIRVKKLHSTQGFPTYPEKFTRCQSFGDEITKSTKLSHLNFLETLNSSKTDI